MNTNNLFKNIRIEYHILQSFPVSCLNRDDVGAPKTAVIGGSTRARVSSQCWKRQVRLALHDLGITLGTRTKLISDLVAEACLREGATEEQANACGSIIEHVFIKGKDEKNPKKQASSEESEADEGNDSSKTDTLLFLSPYEVTILAKAFKENKFEPDATITQKDAKKQAKEIEKLLAKKMNYSIDGLDIALFGRMVAQAAELNVEAAASFAHAISTHKVANEVEFFTALDDKNKEPGAAHMGSLEFNAATYYRYISLDLGQLYTSLAGNSPALVTATEAFTKAIFVAIPSARQSTQSAACPWDYARVMVRRGQRIQAPFSTAVWPKEGGYLVPSITELNSFLDKQEELWGSLYGKIGAFNYNSGKGTGIDDLVKFLASSINGIKK